MSLRPQPQHLGPYEIVRPIGRGGMAEVLLARIAGADGFERTVVIKRILPHHLNERDFIDMFRDEARITAQLRHGNIVQVLEFREDDGQYALVLEHVDGVPLSALVTKSEPLPHATVAFVITEIARALDYAHRKRGQDGAPLGIIHRDISPSNVLVSREGEVKLADFGIARANARLVNTGTDTIKGKLGYIAPETLSSEPTARSDLFSLGVLGWELLVGANPFDADSDHARMYRVLLSPTPRASTKVEGVPAALDDLLDRLVQKEPAARPERASEIVDALAPIVASAERPGMDVLAERVEAVIRAGIPSHAPTRVASGVARRQRAALVIEASPTARALLKSAIGSALHVEVVDDAGAALERAREPGGHASPVALVISQQVLPNGETGVDLCRAIRRVPALAKVTFVLVVFDRTPEVEQAAREAGVSLVVEKSDPAALVKALRDIVAEVAVNEG